MLDVYWNNYKRLHNYGAGIEKQVVNDAIKAQEWHS